MLQTVTRTITCVVYIHYSLFRWKQWEADHSFRRSCGLDAESQLIFLSQTKTNFSFPLHLLQVHQAPPRLLWAPALAHSLAPLHKHCYKMQHRRPTDPLCCLSGDATHLPKPAHQLLYQTGTFRLAHSAAAVKWDLYFSTDKRNVKLESIGVELRGQPLWTKTSKLHELTTEHKKWQTQTTQN